MEKRKITKFRSLCPSDISIYKGATKQEVPPLYKGRLGGGCAFTLVELIVVITILAILGTIAFISLQNYARDARDVKRVSEIKQLFTKIEIEHTKGVPYADLINVLDPDTDCHTGNVLGQNAKICQGPANFGAINENQDSFKDGKNDYIFAYTEPVTVQGGDGTSRNVEFLQGAITLENGTNKVVGNYYTENEDDTSGLVLDTDGEPITDGGNGNVATPPGNTDEENTPTNCTENANCSDGYSCNAGSCVANSCAVQPNYEHATFIEGTPTQINQAWAQGTSGGCYYQCTDGYTGENCEQEPLILSSNCISKGQILTITGSYFTNTEATRAMAGLSNPSCDTPDIMVCIGAGTGMTLATCNVGANVANNTICTSQANCSIERAGLYFQWGNNYGSTIGGPTSSERPDTVTNPYTSIAFIIGNQDWVQTQNDDLWGNITNTNEARQGPCPSGRHVPIATEWEKIASTIDADGYNFSLVANTLSLPKAGYRTYSNGAITFSAATECNDSAVCYWSSSITSSNRPIYLHEYCWETWVDSYNNSRADGCSVRCIKD